MRLLFKTCGVHSSKIPTLFKKNYRVQLKTFYSKPVKKIKLYIKMFMHFLLNETNINLLAASRKKIIILVWIALNLIYYKS